MKFSKKAKQFTITFVAVTTLQCYMFREVFKPEMTIFANDGPLGVQVSLAQSDGLTGVWMPNNWLGIPSPASSVNPTYLFGKIAGPYGSKYYPIFCLVFFSMSAWFFCVCNKFAYPVCFLVAIVASLHGGVFPNVCWGVGSQTIGIGFMFIAIGLLMSYEKSKVHVLRK